MKSEATSVSFYPGLMDDLAPLRVVLADELREVGRRIRHQLDALGPEPCLQVRAAQDLHHFRMNAPNDFRRRLGGHKEAEPRIEPITGDRLADGRRVAEVREALGRRAREQ